MKVIDNLRTHFDKVTTSQDNDQLMGTRKEAYRLFNKLGIPAPGHEEWKYTRIGSLFNKEYNYPVSAPANAGIFTDDMRLPGHEQANELVFINGIFSGELSKIKSAGLQVLPMEQAAAGSFADIISKHLGHSATYLSDGINALNLAFMQGAVFVNLQKMQKLEHPIFIYTINDTSASPVFAQPRSLFYANQGAEAEIVETYATIGNGDALTNQVMEIVLEQDSRIAYYKIQNDTTTSHHVSTTHARLIGKSYMHAVTISLDGGIVRNNMNMVLEADHSEAHLYGLYFVNGDSHIDNHTVVDNQKPYCYSNELYKGIISGQAAAVFNGKIFVRPQAQKINAYQSNKNVLLSDTATVNTKPQLEIFADDVKCSHGCTIGRLDEEGLFYLQSRGIPEQKAKSLLLHGFAMDILEKVRPPRIRTYIDRLISKKLELI